MSDRKIVYLINGDMDLRQSLTCQLRDTGREVWTFPDQAELIVSLPVLRPGCILLAQGDVTRVSLNVLGELCDRIPQWPVIVIARCDALHLAVEAMNRGAWDFLRAPVDDEWLDSTLLMAEAVLMQRLPALQQRPGIAYAM